MKNFILFILIVCVSFIYTKDVCRFPKTWKTRYDFDYKTRKNEWTTPNAKTDYYKLVLSWSPSFCKELPASQRNQTFQCQYNDFGLIVHGFWAQSKSAKTLKQHPRNCRNDKQLPLTTIKRHFCMMPGETLIQGEWEKHGTCSFRTGEEYLDTIERLYNALTIPNLKRILADKRVDQYKIKKGFIEKNPKLHTNQMIIYMKGKELVDIKICYDLKLNYTNCYR
ncbi:unnamed protein product [Adineta steineri]|uniref:Uncharacterized protein n=1 Tax=Adineta steineri TaxID=433720 RepID=A0A815RSR5_9BILA|nr:unnamed protein product [Adineta steineri]CAF3650991.1 unnamed protein product [Adineta steineri]